VNKKIKSHRTEYISLEELENVEHKVKFLVPTVTVVEPPIPRVLSLTNNGSRSQEVSPWIAPTTKFFELREPLNLINTYDQ